MAEAVRPKTTANNKNKKTKQHRDDELSIEERLKSLTTFVNSLVDDDDDDDNGRSAVAIDECQVSESIGKDEKGNRWERQSLNDNDDDYYRTISAKVVEQMPNTYLDLNKKIVLLKMDEHTNTSHSSKAKQQASAPLIDTDDATIMPSASAPPPQSTMQQDNGDQQVVDFNADKVASLYKQFVSYPKLKYATTWHMQHGTTTTTTADQAVQDEYESKLDRFMVTNAYDRELDKHMCLQMDDNIVAEFVRKRQQTDFPLNYGKHEFYDLLKDFYDARLIVDNCLKHIESLKSQTYECATYRVWSFVKYKCESNAFCGDNQRIKHSIDCEKALLNKDAVDKLNVLLNEIRYNIKAVLISSKFCSKLAVLKIEAYFYEQFVLLNKTNEQHARADIVDLIDILFYYKRKKFDDTLYNMMLHTWLVKLLRIGIATTTTPHNSLDFLFYLNEHIFNLPATDIKQYTAYLSHIDIDTRLSRHNMDAMLDKFLKFPLLFTYDMNKTRKLFLVDFDVDQSSLPSTASTQDPHKLSTAHNNNKNNDNWLFVDLDGDLENLDQVQIDLNEDDLIDMYYKIPFYTVYNRLWTILVDHNDHNTTVKCLAFANYIVKITFLTLIQYNRLKYKNFLKLCANTLNESLKFYMLLVNKNRSVLQAYYDDHMRSIYVKFLYSTRLKSMRFTILSLMNVDFNLIALHTKWYLLCMLCGIDVLNDNFNTVVDYNTDDPMRFIDDSVDFYMEDNLRHFNDLELVSFIKIIQLISTSTDNVNGNFYRCLCKIIFKIAFIYPRICDICHKEGTILLVQLANTYPYLISYILKLIDCHSVSNNRTGEPTTTTTTQHDDNADDTSMRYLYLCNQLVFSKWFDHLALGDFHLMHKWLFVDLNRTKFQILFNCFLTFHFNDHSDHIPIDTTMRKLRVLIIINDLYKLLSPQEQQQSQHDQENMNNDRLKQFYMQLTRDSRLKLQTSIWLIVVKLNLNHNLDQLYEQISLTEATNDPTDRFQITKFYLNQMKINSPEHTTTRPLTAYINVILTSNLHDFDRFLTNETLALIDLLIKHKCKLAAYNLVDLYCFNLATYTSQQVDNMVVYDRILNEILHSKGYLLIVQHLFAAESTADDTIEYYFTLTFANLKKLELNRHARELYLNVVLQSLIAANSKWYRCKAVLRFVDALLAYVFIHDNINAFVIKKLLFFVYNDFSSIFTSVESVEQNLFSSYINWFTTTLANTTGSGASDCCTQFAYDKALYRDYPYLGLYLSLCEEQIEQDLGLWLTFNLNISSEVNLMLTAQQQQKINLDTIWKKTIGQINKEKNLNLSPTTIQPNNLMIYKWCERAQGLNIDEPLLIIYWQKFFVLYFSMRYLNTQVNYFNINVNLSSYIKQVKQTLDSLNKQFNQKLTNGAPQQKDIYLKLSQMFYAFALWIDETRLYDLNLDINGLPVHYRSDLLHSLFTRPNELWFDLLNINEIDKHLKKSIKVSLHTAIDINNDRRSTPARHDTHKSELFFNNPMHTRNQEDQLATNHQLYNFEYPLKEQLGVLLTRDKLRTLHADDIEYMKKLCEHLLHQICVYNNELIVNNLNTLKTLDDHYTHKYLPHLYHNEICEKYVQVPCKSLINPMHTCTRAALIKFVYEQKEKHVQTKMELKDNRKKYQKIVHTFDQNEFPQEACVRSMLTLNSLIKKLIANYGLSPDLIGDLLNFIFYMIVNAYEMSLSKFNEDVGMKTVPMPTSNDEHDTVDSCAVNSVNIYLIDLINLIGQFNFKYNTRQSNNLRFLFNFILNKTAADKFNVHLIHLLIQYLSPSQENVIDFYTLLLGNLAKHLKSKQQQQHTVDGAVLATQFDVYLRLFRRFSLEQIKYTTNAANTTPMRTADLYKYVEISKQFLLNLNLHAMTTAFNDNSGTSFVAIVEQLFENFIAILTVNYPCHVEYIFKSLIDLSSQQQLRPLFDRVNNRHLKLFLNFFRKFELLQVHDDGRACNMTDCSLRNLVSYLDEFFTRECSKYSKLGVKENTFLLHWATFVNDLLQIFEFLIDLVIRLNRFGLIEILQFIELLYKKWFYEPVRMDKSSLYYFKLYTEVELVFNSYLKCIEMVVLRNSESEESRHSIAKHLFDKYTNNILVHPNRNDLLVNLFNKTFDKYDDSLLGNIMTSFIPDMNDLNMFLSLCASNTHSVVEFFAFKIVPSLNWSKIIDYYYTTQSIDHEHINKLFCVLLEVLTRLCLNGKIRESNEFDLKLRTVYQQAESIEWSILSDSTYQPLIIELFATNADHSYVFASRSTKHGLLLNALKAAAEFDCYTHTEITSLSCFSTNKRRLFIKALCDILLKPGTVTLLNHNEQKQNMIMNLLNDIESFAINAYKQKYLKNEIDQLLDELLVLVNNDVYLSIIQTWLASSRDSPILVNVLGRLTSSSFSLTCVNSGQFYGLVEAGLESYYDTERRLSPNMEFEFLIQTDYDTIGDEWRYILNEINFNVDFNMHKCLETSSYLLLNAYLLHNYAIIKANEAPRFTSSLFDVCTHVLCSLSGSANYPFSKTPVDKEDKVFVTLKKIIDNLTELLLVYNYKHNDIALLIVKHVLPILFYYADDHVQYTTPSQYQLGQQSTLLGNLLAKKTQYSVKFRFMCRCLAYAISTQVHFNETTSSYEISMESGQTKSRSTMTTSADRVNAISKHSTNLFNSLSQSKVYVQFADLLHNVQSALDSNEFSFLYVNNLLKYLFFNLYPDKFYLS